VPEELARTANNHSLAPVYVGHTDVFLKHLFVTPTNTADMGTLNRSMLEQHHRQVIVASAPTVIAGVGLVTGFIPQTNKYETIPAALKDVRNGVVENSQFTEEISLVFNVAGKGLVVITGCAHRGVINATTYAKSITGINQVAGVIGGFHMTSAPQTTIDATVAAFSSMAVTYIMPMHCTGNRALNALMNALPNSYVHPSVGTKYSF
jgi:7,8-dihydropterin-6-yl-methyl-4-(beta-D-ribofuranosyl)aminobenzene 5'-phosphate synthase